MNCSKIWCSSK